MATPASNKELARTTMAEARAILDKATEMFIEALIAYIRARVQADLLFLDTGDRSLVDDARH